MKQIISVIFYLTTKIIVLVLLGLRIQHRERLPTSGPAILVANHNSHLDTLVLMSLFPLSKVQHLRPVANEEYFLKQNPCLAWFARHILHIIPVSTEAGSCRDNSCNHRNFFKNCADAIAQNQILILYPEGTRGTPESLGEFKSGIAHLAKQHPHVPIVPIFLHGLGKALPKGDFLIVPLLCSIYIGEAIYWNGQKQIFLQQLTERVQALSDERRLSL
jgi:1-acyl-sn-glycerol-3-phosphate acyltransferase